MKKIFENKPRFWFLTGSLFVFFITLFAVSYFAYSQSNLNKDVLAKIDGKSITIQEFKGWLYALDYSGTSSSPTRWETIKDDDKLKKSYFDMYVKELLYQKEAENKGIQITEAEIEKRYDVPGSNYQNLTDEQKRLSRETSKAAMISQRLEDEALGWVAGEYIFYRFDKYYEYEEDMPKIEGAGDQALINKQKEYAQERANEAYQRLTAGGKFSEEITKIENDSEISMNAFAPLTPNFYGKTTKEEYVGSQDLFNQQRYLGLKENIEGLKVGGVTKPFVMKTIANGKMQDFAYVVFQATEVKDGQFSGKENWYKELLKKYKVEIYYSNLGVTGEKDVKYSFENFVKTFIPEAEAACPPTYTSTMRWTELWGQLLVFVPDGVNYYAYPGAKFRLAAGSGTGTDGSQLMVFNGDCSSHYKVHEAFKFAEDDGTWSGLMASSGWYNVAGVGDQVPMLASCGNTRTANLGVYAPVNAAWVTGAGSLGVSWGNCCDNGTWGDRVNEIHKGLDMLNNNGRTVHYQFTYRPKYITNYTLTVKKDGTGAGTVTGTNINCGTDCTETLQEGTVVDLIAASAAGSVFAGWSGAGCSGTGICRVTMDASKTVTATFNANQVAEMSCTVEPNKGFVPLSVVVTVTNPQSGFTYNYDFEKDGTFEYNGRGPQVTFSYSTSGQKTVYVTENNSSRTATCTPALDVTDTNTGDGGEVAP